MRQEMFSCGATPPMLSSSRLVSDEAPIYPML